MIQELKLILDAIGDLSGVALWVVGGFIAYKLIVYMATTGAIVLIAKLAITKTHDAIVSPRPKITKTEISNLCIVSDGTADRLEKALRARIRTIPRKNGATLTYTYLHDEDVDLIIDDMAVGEKLRLEKEKGE